jgi:hypothetical protein
VEDAIAEFARLRPPGIKHMYFIGDLRTKYSRRSGGGPRARSTPRDLSVAATGSSFAGHWPKSGSSRLSCSLSGVFERPERFANC